MNDTIVGIRLSRGGRIYNFDTNNLALAVGQQVMVETEQGLALGVVHNVHTPSLLDEHPNPDFQLPSCSGCAGCAQTCQETADSALLIEPADDAESDPEDDTPNNELPNDLPQGESAPAPQPCPSAAPVLKKVLRIANQDDLGQAERNQDVERRAMAYCRQKVAELNLNMALVRAECLFDRSKIIIYFTSDERLDFRELVHDLAAHMRSKVELRQIGVRQEAKMVGGLGSCGRELCCAHVLREFGQVGVKMAKEQSLSLNPAKISGLCGRLMCCLSYEFETYRALTKQMPKVGKKVKISPELEGKVLRHTPLTGHLTILLSDGRTVTCTLEEMAKLEPEENTRRNNRVPMPPRPAPKDETPAMEALPEAEPERTTMDETGEKPPAKRRSRRSRGRRKNKKTQAGSAGNSVSAT